MDNGEAARIRWNAESRPIVTKAVRNCVRGCFDQNRASLTKGPLAK